MWAIYFKLKSLLGVYLKACSFCCRCGEGFVCYRTSHFFPSISVVWWDASFPSVPGLVLWLRWAVDTARLLQSASMRCCLYFISADGLRSGRCFLEHSHPLPPCCVACHQAGLHWLLWLWKAALPCLFVFITSSVLNIV